ncbi:MAG: hypothetical protein U0M12_07530 [Acutalibacteraceae bacterium]|nr:hypothetical protein [Acutalibacteraceae bacterium]
MKKLSKLSILFIVLVGFLCTNILPCSAEDILYGTVNVASQVSKNKNFTANLQVQCNTPVSVVMFTLVYGDELEYKSCKVNDNDSGYIEKYQEGNTLKIMYINVTGIDTTNIRTLVDVTFKTCNNTCDTSLEIYTNYSTDSNEQSLIDSTGIVYDLQIVEKVSSNVSSANGRTLNSSSSSKISNSSSNNNESIPKRTENNADNSENTTENATENKNVVNVLNDDNNILIFVAGISFALAVGVVILVSYNAGKKHSKHKKEKQ